MYIYTSRCFGGTELTIKKSSSRKKKLAIVFEAVYKTSRAGVAQLVEHLTCNQVVAGSSPIASSTYFSQ